MLTSRIFVPLPSEPESEDIFSSALPNLFTDDTQNSHGTPGSSIIYRSPRFGNITLRIPAHPDVEEGRNLFAHYLWNAGVIAADAIEAASVDEKAERPPPPLHAWNRDFWDMRGKRILELGAGTALPSLMAVLCGASSATITDHPSSPALTTGAIEQNVKENLLREAGGDAITAVHVLGYTWGTTTMYSYHTYGKPAERQPDPCDRIIIADCLWMPLQHVNLVKTILHYLDPSSPHNCALVVAGFHTGRGIVRSFFETATEDARDEDGRQREGPVTDDQPGDADLLAVQGRLKTAEIFEVDVSGNRRPWQPVRGGESKEEARRWCVCAVLVRR